jgi:hypothetical protein
MAAIWPNSWCESTSQAVRYTRERLNLGGNVRDHPLDGLLLGDGTAEGLAIRRVLHAHIKNGLGASQPACSQSDPAQV